MYVGVSSKQSFSVFNIFYGFMLHMQLHIELLKSGKSSRENRVVKAMPV